MSQGTQLVGFVSTWSNHWTWPVGKTNLDQGTSRDGGFHSHGATPQSSSILVLEIFPEINHPAFLGYPHGSGTTPDVICWNIDLDPLNTQLGREHDWHVCRQGHLRLRFSSYTGLDVDWRHWNRNPQPNGTAKLKAELSRQGEEGKTTMTHQCCDTEVS